MTQPLSPYFQAEYDRLVDLVKAAKNEKELMMALSTPTTTNPTVTATTKTIKTYTVTLSEVDAQKLYDILNRHITGTELGKLMAALANAGVNTASYFTNNNKYSPASASSAYGSGGYGWPYAVLEPKNKTAF